MVAFTPVEPDVRGSRWRGLGWPDALAGASIVGFCFVASRRIDVPGLYYDELFQVLSGLFFVQGHLPDAAFAFGTGPEVSIFDHPMSSMSMTYIGAVKNIAFTPVAALFGVTIESVRYFTIALSAATMLATYVFARRLFRDDAAAAIAVALLAFDPSFVFYSRVDFGPVVVMLLLKTLAAWQLLRWYETGRRSSLALGAFLLGLGLYDKANFAWIIAAFAVAAAIVGGRRLRARLTRRAVLVAAAAFLVGCLPLLIYNARSGLGTLAAYDTLPERAGSFPFQVAHRVAVLGDLLDGSAVSEVLELRFPHRFLVLPLIFGLAAAVFALPAVRHRLDARAARAGSFIVLSLAVTLLLAAATSAGFRGHHVLTTYPLPHFALALVIVQVARVVARRVRDGRRVAVFAATAGVLAAIPVALSAFTTTGMLEALRASGGRAEWSDRIVLLDEYLTREHGGQPVMTVDWGIANNLLALSGGGMELTEASYAFEGLQSRLRGSPRDLLGRSLGSRSTWFVLHSPEATQFGNARLRFFATLKSLGRRPVLLRRMGDRGGRPLFEVYAAAKG